MKYYEVTTTWDGYTEPSIRPLSSYILSESALTECVVESDHIGPGSLNAKTPDKIWVRIREVDVNGIKMPFQGTSADITPTFYTVIYERVIHDTVPGRFTQYPIEKKVTMAVVRVPGVDLAEVVGWISNHNYRLLEIKTMREPVAMTKP